MVKTWKDASGRALTADLPAGIELQLVRCSGEDAQPVGEKVTVTPDDEGNWTYTFRNLPLYVDGERAAYSVIETPIEGFTNNVEVDFDGANTTIALTNVKDDENPDPCSSVTPPPTTSTTPMAPIVPGPPTTPSEPKEHTTPVVPGVPDEPSHTVTTVPGNTVNPGSPGTPSVPGTPGTPVESNEPELARTGANVLALAGVGTLLMFVGAVFVLRGRRKES